MFHFPTTGEKSGHDEDAWSGHLVVPDFYRRSKLLCTSTVFTVVRLTVVWDTLDESFSIKIRLVVHLRTNLHSDWIKI